MYGSSMFPDNKYLKKLFKSSFSAFSEEILNFLFICFFLLIIFSMLSALLLKSSFVYSVFKISALLYTISTNFSPSKAPYLFMRNIKSDKSSCKSKILSDAIFEASKKNMM